MVKAAKKTKAKSTEVAIATTEIGPMTVGGRSFKVSKVVTVPLLKHPKGGKVAFTIGSEMYEGRKMAGDRGTPTMIQVVDLETGINCEYIVPKILKTRFEEQYPDGDYVGRSFAVHKSAELSGKGDRQYSTLQILEIEVE